MRVWGKCKISRFESALHRASAWSSGLPYWDSRLDADLPNPADSVVWTDG